MAARRTIDLGTVGFGLVPETKALEQSLTALRKFGKEVERLGQVEDELVQKQYRKFASIERILTTLYVRTSATIARMKEAGVAAAEIDKVDQAYKRVNTTLTKQADLLSRSQIARASIGMGAIISGGNRLASQKEVGGLALAFRDLERAAILAIGPLSGVGARLAVMAALFESVGSKMTLMIAGATGVVAGISLLGAAGVKATMDMERFNAQLEASTGAAALNADAYQYLLNLSNRLGQNVRELVEPYAKFTTAARLSNVELSTQRKIFEAATIAGTSMRLNSERMSLVFLALEQMLSKGTVSMEELRRQLGDLLPGSFELAAKAMGVGTGELAKMIKNGEVLAKDLLPKLAEQWVMAFGPSAQRASQSLQAELQRVGTSTFELLKRFDQVTRFSDLFREGVVLTRKTLDFFARNMEEIIALFGALVGAGVGLAVLQLFTRLPAAIAATTAALKQLAVWITGLNLATMATGVGAVAQALLRLTVVLGTAAAGYMLLKREIDPAAEAMKTWIDETGNWLNVQENIAKSHKQTTNELRSGTLERLAIMTTEANALKANVERQLAIQKKLVEEQNRNAMKPWGIWDSIKAVLGARKLKEMQIELEAAEAQVRKLDELFMKLSKRPTEDATPAGGDVGTQWENWAEKIKQSIREVTGLGEQLKAAEFGQGAIEQARGMAKAIEMMADQPEKGRGNIAMISKWLRDAGFEGANLTEQLSKLYLLIEQRKDTLKELEALPGKAATAGEAIAKMFEMVEARRQAATVGDVGSQTQLEKQLVTMEHHFEVLRKMGLTQEHINFLVAEFRRQWAEMETAETGVQTVEKLTRKIEQLDNQLGDKSVRVMEEYRDRVELVWQAFGHGIGTLEDLERRLALIQDDMNRKVIDRMSVFGRSIRETFRDIEDQTAAALARMTRGQEAGWQQMFDAILQTIYEFMYKIMVIQPIMTALFGQLYTGKTSTAEGVFEAFLRQLAPAVAGGMGGAGAASAGGVDEAGFTAAFGGENPVRYSADYLGFARGGSFDVGGSGGPDSQLVGFRATPGEHVEVTPPGENMGQSVKVIVRNESGVPMEGTMGATAFDAEGAVVELFLRRLGRDAAARERLATLTRPPRY
jgi:tape measure domain-containing protein